MTTVTELFEKTTDGNPPPQKLGTENQQVLQFPTMSMFSRQGVTYFAPPSGGTFLKGNLITLPAANLAGGLTIALSKPALEVSFDYWIGAIGEEGLARLRAYFLMGTEQLGEVQAEVKTNSYKGTLTFRTTDPGKKITHVVVLSYGAPGAINRFVMRDD